eukprot:14528787-Alexandrium_andersonii.AAC.1
MCPSTSTVSRSNAHVDVGFALRRRAHIVPELAKPSCAYLLRDSSPQDGANLSLAEYSFVAPGLSSSGRALCCSS